MIFIRIFKAPLNQSLKNIITHFQRIGNTIQWKISDFRYQSRNMKNIKSNRHIAKCLFLSLLLIQLYACSLKENPEQDLVSMLEVTKNFRTEMLKRYPKWESVEMPYKGVKGKDIPIQGLRWWRGAQRSFYFPKDTVLNQGYSVHFMLMYNRKKALDLFRSFCKDSRWQENQILSNAARVYLYRNSILYINRETETSDVIFEAAARILETRIKFEKGYQSCACPGK